MSGTIPTLDEVRRERARRDFGYFLRWSRPDWNWDWPHIVALTEKVQQTMDGKAPPMLLAEIGPQYGKTQLMTVGLCVWLLLRYPGIRIAIGSYSQESANRMSLEARRLAESIGIKLDGERSAVTEWMIEGGGRVRAVGRGGSLTGFPVDVMLLDDLLKDMAEAMSPTVRESVREWISSVVMTRRPQYVLATGTPWHEEGPQTYLREKYGEILHELVLPSFAVAGDYLGRKEGEPLCIERWPVETLERERKANPRTFEALFQCNPTPREGSFFKVSGFQFCEASEVPECKKIRIWDLASSLEGDYTVGALMGKHEAKKYVTDVVRGRWGPGERNEIIRRTAEQDGRSVKQCFAQDPGQAGVDQVHAIRRLLDGFSLEFERETGSKETRADPYASQVEGGNIVLVRSHWTTDFVEEHRQFPNGKNDDQVDVSARGNNILARGGGRVVSV